MASKGQESREIDTNSSSSKDKTKSGEYMLNRPPKKPGGREVFDNNTATTISCETASEQENSCKTITNMLRKTEVPNIVRMEKETNQNKKGSLPWSDYSGDTKIRARHEDKRKNQVTITADKEDDTDSTATVTTATFASGCGSEWDDDIIEGLAEPTTLNDQIYVFGKRRWMKPSRKWRKSTS